MSRQRQYTSSEERHQSRVQHQQQQQQQQHMNRRQDFGYSRTVSYLNGNHWSVITQRWGSVHVKVMPFCLANMLLSIILVWLLQNDVVDLSMSEFGHEFMSILVSFLVINKLAFSLTLYYELQGYLATMNRSMVDLTQLACTYTKSRGNSSIDDPAAEEHAKMWRHKVTYQALLLLKTTMAVIFKGGQQQRVWEMAELRDDRPLLYVDECLDTKSVQQTEGGGDRPQTPIAGPPATIPKELYMWGYHLQSDLNLRVPIRMAQRLREAIVGRRDIDQIARSDSMMMIDIQEQNLLGHVQAFMESYYGIRKYLTCPLPFPLVQLGRIFVMFYVFTLPFALLSPQLNLKYVQMVILVGLMTYGFMGLELLFVEIDDPFAEDPNDLPLGEEALAAGEDIMLNLMYTDGRDAVDALRSKLTMKLDGYHAEVNAQVQANPPRLVSKLKSQRKQQQQQQFRTETDPLV